MIKNEFLFKLQNKIIENGIYLGVGKTGSGKTSFINEEIKKENIKLSIFAIDLLYFDVNNNEHSEKLLSSFERIKLKIEEGKNPLVIFDEAHKLIQLDNENFEKIVSFFKEIGDKAIIFLLTQSKEDLDILQKKGLEIKDVIEFKEETNLENILNEDFIEDNTELNDIEKETETQDAIDVFDLDDIDGIEENNIEEELKIDDITNEGDISDIELDELEELEISEDIKK